MSKKKLTIEEVAEVVESEGLCYAVEFYLDPERIEDPKLKELWEIAAISIKGIRAFIEPYTWIDDEAYD